MSEVKLPCCCTICDAECFESLARWDEGEPRAGQIKRAGPPLRGAMRIVFELFDGSTCDMTFCHQCSEVLTPAHYPAIWKKVINSWLATMEGAVPDWFKKQPGNGILIELKRTPWTFHAQGGESVLG